MGRSEKRGGFMEREFRTDELYSSKKFASNSQDISVVLGRNGEQITQDNRQRKGTAVL